MIESKSWGGAREGAGRPHEHQEYLLVEVVDFYGDKDVLIAGMIGSRGVKARAQSIAAHHVNEQALSVKIVKHLCCSHGESALVEIVKHDQAAIDIREELKK